MKNNKHQQILKRIDTDFLQADDNQTESYNDRRFVFISGAQWDGDLGQQFENRPKFEFNKILLSITRIYNEWTRNRFSVEFKADDNMADDETANTLNKLMRADERDSNADEAYSNAFIEGISGGIGAFMLIAEYENPFNDDTKQRIRIKPIFEADSCVYWDSNAKRYDKADAKHVTIVVSMSHDDFKRKYKKDDVGFDNLQGVRFGWVDDDNIKVAEHYEIREIKREIIKLQHQYESEPKTLYKDDEFFDVEYQQLMMQGYQVILEKTIKERAVFGYVLSGSGIIENIGQIAGKHLPVVPYYGKRMYISGREITQGHARLPKDAQKAYNIKMSSLIDLSSRPQDELPIFTTEQIKGHEKIWARKEVSKPPFLTINPLRNIDGSIMMVGTQSYTRPPQVPPALAAIIEKSDSDIHELTGNQSHGEQLVSNVSTEAVEMVQEKVDAQSYIYIDNWAKTMKHAGMVWLSIAQDIYDEESRKMSGMTHDEKDEQIIINKPMMKDGELVYENDMQNGHYRVAVDVGEVFATQRDKTVKRLVNILPMIGEPQTQSVLINTILANLDGEGMRDLSQFARKQLIGIGVVEPTESEQQEIMQAQMMAQNEPPDPQTLWLQAEAQKANAIAEKQKADTQKTLAQADDTRANTAKTLFEIEQQQAQTQATLQSIMAMLQTMQQSQAQSNEQIKQEVSGEQPQMTSELLQNIQPPME